MPQQLSLLSYNIQAAGHTRRLHEYITRGWEHLLPHPRKRGNLDSIACLAAGFDVVGLQEADPGSLRSGFVNQTHYLAESAGFPWWSHQPNRRVGQLATSANALLSRHQPDAVTDHPLPGPISGRGVLLAHYRLGQTRLTVAIAHLSLGARARARQLGYIAEVLQDEAHPVLMGDFNCDAGARELDVLYRKTRLQPPDTPAATYPSWRPARSLDHILVGRDLDVLERRILPNAHSDHLAVAATIRLPQARQRAA